MSDRKASLPPQHSELPPPLAPASRPRTERTHADHLLSLQNKGSSVKVVVIGDSTVERVGTIFGADFLPGLTSLGVELAGVGGDRLCNVLWRVQRLMPSIPDTVHTIALLAGVNDIMADATPDQVCAGQLAVLDSLARVCSTRPVKLVLIPMVPLRKQGGEGAQGMMSQERAAHLNHAIHITHTLLRKALDNPSDLGSYPFLARAASERLVTFTEDLHAVVSESVTDVHADYVHLNKVGYTMLLRNLFDELLRVAPPDTFPTVKEVHRLLGMPTISPPRHAVHKKKSRLQ